MNEFLDKIAAILEVDSVNEGDELKAFSQLDSLGVLSIIAMLDASYGVNIGTVEIEHMNTFGDLWKQVQCMRGV